MYQALYRQYRPKTFDQVLGQKHITITLKNQINKGNIGHAYLFSGTRGTGKTSTAKIFSRAVNCLNRVDGNPCNECEICKGLLDESIIDVIEMDAASNRGIDDIRELREKVVYPPSRTSYKVYIIDEVHMLTQQAFNALLKTLEEPPKHLIFILATTEPEKLLPTILSRCQRFDFKRVSSKDIIINMENISRQLEIPVEDRVFSLIARNSDGAMRDALSLLDQCISFSGGEITYEDAIDILGITNADLIINISDDIIDKNLENALNTIDDIIQDGKDINQFIKDLIYHFRNLMIMKTSKNPLELIEIDEGLSDRYLNQSKMINLNFILRALDILTIADEKSRWSTQPRIILEMATIQLIQEEVGKSLEERVRLLEKNLRVEATPTKEPIRTVQTNIEKTLKTLPVESKPQAESKAKPKQINKGTIDSEGELKFETIRTNWDEVLQEIKSKKMNIFALLIEGEPVSFVNNLLTIEYKEGFGFHKDAVSSPANKEFIEQIFNTYFNKKMDINFIMCNSNLKNKAEEKKDNDKAIKEVIDFFGEDIVEIK